MQREGERGREGDRERERERERERGRERDMNPTKIYYFKAILIAFNVSDEMVLDDIGYHYRHTWHDKLIDL